MARACRGLSLASRGSAPAREDGDSSGRPSDPRRGWRWRPIQGPARRRRGGRAPSLSSEPVVDRDPLRRGEPTVPIRHRYSGIAFQSSRGIIRLGPLRTTCGWNGNARRRGRPFYHPLRPIRNLLRQAPLLRFSGRPGPHRRYKFRGGSHRQGVAAEIPSDTRTPSAAPSAQASKVAFMDMKPDPRPPHRGFKASTVWRGPDVDGADAGRITNSQLPGPGRAGVRGASLSTERELGGSTGQTRSSASARRKSWGRARQGR